MAIDLDILRQGLIEYRQSLLANHRTLRVDYDQIQGTFLHLNSVYEGQAAETFKSAGRATAEWFEGYLTETQLLIQLLDERLEALEQASIS